MRNLFTQPHRAIGGAAPFDGMEALNLDEASDEDLHNILQDDLTPRWLKEEIRTELQLRAEEEHG